jgi:hypothetical protein
MQPKTGQNWAQMAQRGPAQHFQRALAGASPRTRPQPGPGPGKLLPAWAKSGPRARPLSSAVGSNPTAVRPSRAGKTPRRSRSPQNPRAISSVSPRPLLPASPLPPRDGGRRCGAAAGLLAGECARLDVSAPPSSGLGVASWPTLHGAVEIPSSGWLGMQLSCDDGGSPGLLSLGVACPWSWELLVGR